MKWYLETGPEGDTVISTRIRLARNIEEFPFPCKMTPEQFKKVSEKAGSAIMDGNSAIAGDFEYIDMQRLTPARAMSLAEKHLISPDFAQNREGRALLLNRDETVSIMVGEEDHIRIQTLFAGLKLDEALELAGRIDDLFDEKLHFAFDENLGYLTQCPTNLGTGLRASLMLHLPAIAEAGAIPSLTATLQKFGLTTRGIYGEGSAAKGAFFQISNQVTLGISEKEAAENLKGIALQIITQERNAREAMGKTGSVLEDRIWRSYGVLTSARLLSADEFMSLISDVRLGVLLGILKDISLETINTLLYEVQPATLIAAAGRNLDAPSRDLFRAKTVREKLVRQE